MVESEIGSSKIGITLQIVVEKVKEDTKMTERVELTDEMYETIAQETAEIDQKMCISHFVLLKFIGMGCFGDAWFARDVKTDNSLCVKLMKNEEKLTMQTYRDELEVLEMGLDHPNVVKGITGGYAQLYQDGQPKCMKYFIASELAEKGELFNMISEAQLYPQGMTPRIVRQLFGQILEGLEYIHDKGLAHRDMKLDNCFLDQHVKIKVADFGCKKSLQSVMRTQVGADRCRAPEINGSEYQGKPVDIFSCGVILFVMLTGKAPFNIANDINHKRILRQAKRAMAMRKIEVSEIATDLFNKMTAIDPEVRYTMAQVKEHPWMKEGECATEEEVA